MKRIIKKLLIKNSCNYWEQRYKKGGFSGNGSRGDEVKRKADFVNDFIDQNNIETLIDFGCGDGEFCSLLDIKNYIGLDVSKTIVNECKKKFITDTSKRFLLYKDKASLKADLAISLDVIFHLLENRVFNEYMHKLFHSSNKYIIIYSSNVNQKTTSFHVKHRKFTDWINHNKKEWELISTTKDFCSKNNPKKEFYIYKKK